MNLYCLIIIFYNTLPYHTLDKGNNEIFKISDNATILPFLKKQ